MFEDWKPEDLIHLDIDFEQIRIPVTTTLAMFVYLLFYVNVYYPQYDYIGDRTIGIEMPGEYQQSEILSVLMIGQ